MWLGVEIGGTKLQLGVGAADGSPLVELVRFDVEPRAGARGILDRIAAEGAALASRHRVQGVGIGFGGPIDVARGVVLKSHHIDGWTDFPIVAWCREALSLPAALGNDADLAGLAEARFGAGRGYDPVFYVTVGTGIGGGLIVGGRVYAGSGRGAAEIGHLRPGLDADRPESNLESLASGWGIAAQMRNKLQATDRANERFRADLLARMDGDPSRATAKGVVEAAAAGNPLAREVLAGACRALGWGVAQVITLVAPAAVVIGGGVSLAGEELFFAPLRQAVDRYVFPPYAGRFEIKPAQLGEEMVVYGAIAQAAEL